MKKNILLLFIICSNILYSQENSLLWEITGNGLTKPSYLYGTYHSKDSRAHQFGDSVLIKLSKSDILVVENVDMQEIGQKKAFEMSLMKDKKLEDLLSHKDYIFVRDNAIAKMGTNAMFLNNMKPIFTMIFADLLISRQEMLLTVDEFIKQQAKDQGKKIFGLETGEEAMHALDQITLKEQSEMLLDFFKNYDQNQLLGDSLIKIYQSQDLNKLYSFYSNKKSVPLSFDVSLLTERNKKFTDKLIELINKRSVFCAVGALHLPGETGLINALRKKGYVVSPIKSKYTPKTYFFDDKREWYNYVIDSLYLTMSFPNDPYSEASTFTLEDSKPVNSVDYYFTDSLNGLKYMVTVLGLPKKLSHETNESIYKEVLDQLNRSKGYKKITESTIEYQGVVSKEAEFNVSAGINSRNKIFTKGGNIYIVGISGYKNKIYSNIAEHFFDEIYIPSSKLQLDLEIEDETHQPLADFQISIKSTDIDTVLLADTAGSISFIFPSMETEYNVTVLSKNYVSKKSLINTSGINKLYEKEITLSATISMMKKNDGVDYSVFNTPTAKACLIDNSKFVWDMAYIAKRKKEIKKVFPEYEK